MTRASYLLWI